MTPTPETTVNDLQIKLCNAALAKSLKRLINFNKALIWMGAVETRQALGAEIEVHEKVLEWAEIE